ncbi:MAG: hypothetical protein QXL82_01560 [Candidatus Aenigmatarchaeota archaeon]
MDLLFFIGLILIFIGIFLIVLSALINIKKQGIKQESGFVIVVWPFFVAGGNERTVTILLTLAIILTIVLLALFLIKVFV